MDGDSCTPEAEVEGPVPAPAVVSAPTAAAKEPVMASRCVRSHRNTSDGKQLSQSAKAQLWQVCFSSLWSFHTLNWATPAYCPYNDVRLVADRLN